MHSDFASEASAPGIGGEIYQQPSAAIHNATCQRDKNGEDIHALKSEVRVGGIEVLEQLKEPWTHLCMEAGGEPFLSSAWIEAYLRAFEPGAELVVFMVWAGQKLVAILPLTLNWIWFYGIRLRELRGTANVHSVLFDVLRAPNQAGEKALRAIWFSIRTFRGWHVLQLSSFPKFGRCRELLTCAARDGFDTMTDVFADNPVLLLRDGDNAVLDPLANTSAHFRKELRRGARWLEVNGGVPRLVRQCKFDAEELGRFYKLEAAGWKGRQGTAIKECSEALCFYDQILQIAEKCGGFRFHKLTVEGKIIAACVGLELGGCYYALKLAYDEEFRRCSPGHLLIHAVLKDCSLHGVRKVFLGGKMVAYKKQWTSTMDERLTGFVFHSALRSQFVSYEKRRLFPWLRHLQRQLHSYLPDGARQTAGTQHARGTSEID